MSIMKNKSRWKNKAILLANTGTISWRQIAKSLGVPKSSCSDHLRNYYENKDDAAEKEIEEKYFKGFGYKKDKFPVLFKEGAAVTTPVKEPDNSRILLISDLHSPYSHKDALKFLKSLKEKYNPTRIICLGDETEGAKLSYHEHDADLPSAGDELKAAQKFLKQLEELFPRMDILNSNHGSLVYRKAKTHGIPMHYIKNYNDILGVGEGWQWYDELIVDLPNGQKVYMHHGKSANALKVSQTMGMNYVCGHFHNSFGIQYWSSPSGLFWTMNSGCLIDNKALCFAYNKLGTTRPIIGTSLIIDSVPILEALPL